MHHRLHRFGLSAAPILRATQALASVFSANRSAAASHPFIHHPASLFPMSTFMMFAPSMVTSCRRLLACAAFAVALALTAPSVWSAPASDKSVETLLAVTQSEKLIVKMGADMEKHIRGGVQAGLNGRQPTKQEQQYIDKVVRESAAVIREEMNWAAMRPLMVKIYKDTFTQEEVDGQIAFYRSPVGTAVIAKMPAVMDATMVAMHQNMQSITPKLQAIAEKAQKELDPAGAAPTQQPKKK
jgi:hypothetical protein